MPSATKWKIQKLKTDKKKHNNQHQVLYPEEKERLLKNLNIHTKTKILLVSAAKIT